MLDQSSAVWRKSRHSGGGNNCVEVADLTAAVGVRDSKNPDAGHLTVGRADLAAFFARVKGGEFDL